MNPSGGYRLPTGGRIDRTRLLRFTFNGEEMIGHPGDTLASALIASGVSIVSRSLKYHRPRGFYGVGLEDPQSMLAVRDTYGYPTIRAGQVCLAQGMQAQTLRGTPSVKFDLGAIAQLASNALAAGFYYKTFMWSSWRWFEALIRSTTGVGQKWTAGSFNIATQRVTYSSSAAAWLGSWLLFRFRTAASKYSSQRSNRF